MKYLFLLILMACAHPDPIVTAPAWVSAVRNGEESLKVQHGSKVFYRRVAGGPELSRQVSCNLVIMKAEEDIKKEYPHHGEIPATVEVLYFDPIQKDCAVTMSVRSDLKVQPERSVASTDEEEAARLVEVRSETARKFALTGLTKNEFEKFAQDTVVINQGPSLCQNTFKTADYSIHGTTHVCWLAESVRGYCSMKERQCWTKTP